MIITNQGDVLFMIMGDSVSNSFVFSFLHHHLLQAQDFGATSAPTTLDAVRTCRSAHTRTHVYL